jgi:hypothetical protein
MTRHLQRLISPEHSRTRAELILALAIVEPRVSASDEQKEMIAGAH